MSLTEWISVAIVAGTIGFGIGLIGPNVFRGKPKPMTKEETETLLRVVKDLRKDIKDYGDSLK